MSWCRLYDADLHLSHLFAACPVVRARKGGEKKKRRKDRLMSKQEVSADTALITVSTRSVL